MSGNQEAYKNRNDPGRFFGDGVIFKAKLIGILEVGEARGDRMCQEALQDLKMAIRAAGEHKQRITINVTIDGLRLRDEKTGDSLYHHPVHKISFIAQDMTDSRAFGYIFGSPDSGHRFFGIKTDKAASQVVLAMRDLFQVVFELKKKEIELARQHIQSKTVHEHQPITLNIKSSGMESSNVSVTYTKSISEPSTSKYTPAKEMSPESVADLVDLEQELSSIQRGITQMERITPSEPSAKLPTEEDPFGDSFTPFPAYNLLPPPESSKSRHSKPLKPPEEVKPSVPVAEPPGQATTPLTAAKEGWSSSLSAPAFEDPIAPIEPIEEPPRRGDDSRSSSLENSTSITLSGSAPIASQYLDAFSDLDPLGTGRSKPYVDKKYFFQDLKNPPKKVLKDLSEKESIFSANFPNNGGESTPSRASADIFEGNSSDLNKPIDGSACASNGLASAEFTAHFPPTDAYTFNSNTSNANTNDSFVSDANKTKTDDSIIGNNRALLVTDNDPFSPRMKKNDPFDTDFVRSPLDPFEFSFGKDTSKKQTVLPDTRIDEIERKGASVFNGPLQVSLPPESYSAYMNQKRLERQTSDTNESMVRHRPNVFKQNTVDVISSIRKPHLFGQKFSKRDSNSINMRRLQESDSMSESEAAPEPPPRPESHSHAEPPPLPPKKQFSDIVIRPRVTSPLAREPLKYEYLGAQKKNASNISQQSNDTPALPLPSRRVGRTETAYPGPGRPAKKTAKEEDDYLTPITSVPVLLPPPQIRGSIKNRGRRSESGTPSNAEVKSISSDSVRKTPSPAATAVIPDITLSQLLTLGIDDLASKLNVPPSKLNTMTIVELTKYLSDFIEKTSQKNVPAASEPIKKSPTPAIKKASESAIFKVSFDDASDATFVARFDDNFGEESSFTPNFDHFNEKPTSAVDRYAAFREIIDQETKNEDDEPFDSHQSNGIQSEVENIIGDLPAPAPIVNKIDTKITQAISQAKDRYAALRDIILVEDLFDRSNNFTGDAMLFDSPTTESIPVQIHNLMETGRELDADSRSSPEVNISINLEDVESERTKTDATPTISQPILSCKDDIEIDEYMNRALSNLSLDSRDHLSPLSSKSPVTKSQNASTSPIQIQQIRKSPLAAPLSSLESLRGATLNDVSTSPIPISKSPLCKSPLSKSPLSKSPLNKSPLNKSPLSRSPNIDSMVTTPKSPNLQALAEITESNMEALLEGTKKIDIPLDAGAEIAIETPKSAVNTDSWAVFEPDSKLKEAGNVRASKEGALKGVGESPCSSEEKNDWKTEQEYNKRWPRAHTSSSSRDLSPWDDDAPEYRSRRGVPPDRHGFYMRHARRMNSCDDDYEYEEELAKRRERRTASKGAMSRSRENFDSDAQWYHPPNHHSWSPQDEDENCDRNRSFERSSYERSTYGPPYEKRDRAAYKGYDKRRYYREYCRPGYDYDYDPQDRKMAYYDEYDPRFKGRKDYEDVYESPGYVKRTNKDYFYDGRDKRSFDRESTESFDSNGRRRKSFGSGEMYGSLDSRNRDDYRERYSSAERKRSMRKVNKNLRANEEEYEQDSEGEAALRTATGGDTRSLQRTPQSGRPRKSSGSSPWDGEADLISTPGQKTWKRPASASESERRRNMGHTLSGSDGEKDRRLPKKHRSRPKEIESRSNYATMRYGSSHRDDEYEMEGADYDDDDDCRSSRRKLDRSTGMLADRRKKDAFDSPRNMESMHKFSKSSRDVYYHERDPSPRYDSFEPLQRGSRSGSRRDHNYDGYEESPQSAATNTKFNFDQGFESDFNSTPVEKSLRFSADFSDKESSRQHSHTSAPSSAKDKPHTSGSATPNQPKLRFDEKITVSKFETNADLFDDDDFSKAQFDFENEDQWIEELPRKNNLKSHSAHKRFENIKKSESVNIFAKNQDDPFEDDDFFKKPSPDNNNKKNPQNNGHQNNNYKWENSFAKFDENI